MLINLYDFEEESKRILSKTDYDFISGGATDEVTLRRTRALYDSISLRPRMLVDVSHNEISTTVLEQNINLPIMLAPTGNHTKAHKDGELATVRAAGNIGTIMILSINAGYLMEEVAKAATGPIWFQHYMFKDRELTLSMVQKAENLGYSALCMTLDTRGVRPKRERNLRNKYSSTPSPNLPDSIMKERSRLALEGSSLYDYSYGDPSANWPYLEWLASKTSLPIVVKGIMTKEDAELSLEHGVKGIIVSNHGARYLDTTFTTIEVLPEIVDAVGSSIDVYLDGGIRRGTDILKAIALGAKCVLIGRPIFWGLATAGQDGLERVLHILTDELRRAMIQCGCPDLNQVNRNLVALKSPLESYLDSK